MKKEFSTKAIILSMLVFSIGTANASNLIESSMSYQCFFGKNGDGINIDIYAAGHPMSDLEISTSIGQFTEKKIGFGSKFFLKTKFSPQAKCVLSMIGSSAFDGSISICLKDIHKDILVTETDLKIIRHSKEEEIAKCIRVPKTKKSQN